MTLTELQCGDIHLCSFHDVSGFGKTDKGRIVHWDFSDRFGPLFLDGPSGEPLKRQPGPRSKSFKVFEEWHKELRQEQLAMLTERKP